MCCHVGGLDGVQDVKTSPILIWQGEADDDVPPSVARHIAARLGAERCRATFIAGESHSMIRRHWASILSALKEVAVEGERSNVASTSEKL